MKTALIVGGALLAGFALFRVGHALYVGTEILPALKWPTLDPRVAYFVEHPERTQTRTGATHL